MRQDRPLPESLEPGDVEVFLGDLNTHRDRAMMLAMLLGGLRASEVRTLRLADVDMGMRQVKVTGKGAKQRIVPIDRAFFGEVRAYLDRERPKGLSTPECFVVLRGPTAVGRSPRRDSGRSSGSIGHGRERSGFVRIVCGTRSGPTSPQPASICWCCAS